MALLEVDDLHVTVTTEDGPVPVIDGVSLRVDAGETVCLVGESGSGKSVTAMSVLRLNPEPAFAYPRGAIRVAGVDTLRMPARQLRATRGGTVAMVFQDPTTSLNPAHRIGDQIVEAIRAHQDVSRADARRRALEVLTDVAIAEPERRLDQYPHQLSGGMRQRVLIAMALACRPRLLIADEPTTALDVTTQARILELLRELSAKYELALLLVTHDLGVVAQMADRVLVMYAGRIVEAAASRDVFYDPLMPYTDGLLNSRPRSVADRGALTPIPGAPPRLGDWGAGCRFAPRCRLAEARCRTESPALTAPDRGHLRACLLDIDDVRARRLVHRQVAAR
ncbi:ABC transporter ATP-binding protein [Phytohabitans kaempferiae]|uniref:ABC transporter ATP-binding protein n=1 Tax=Phytohabitans kaempferiae TaxID=1620943 RepID=A0ABV6MCC8_9ACTN